MKVDQCEQQGFVEEEDRVMDPGKITQSEKDEQGNGDSPNDKTAEEDNKIVIKSTEHAESANTNVQELGDVCISPEITGKGNDGDPIYATNTLTSEGLVGDTNKTTKSSHQEAETTNQKDEKVQSLVVEDISGKKVFEVQLNLNETQITPDTESVQDLEEPVVKDKCGNDLSSGIIVRNIHHVHGSQSLKNVILSSDTMPLKRCVRKCRDGNPVKVSSAQKQDVCENRGSQKLGQKARNQQGYVPTCHQNSKAQRALKDNEGTDSLCKGKELLSTCTVEESAASNDLLQEDPSVCKGNVETVTQNTSLLKPSSTSSNHSATEDTPYRRKSKRKRNQHPSNVTSTNSHTDCNSAKREKSDAINKTDISKTSQSHSDKRTTSNYCKRIDTQHTKHCNTVAKVKDQTYMEHKLDLSGISYFELVKLRDACNYYIKQYETVFLQQRGIMVENNRASVPGNFQRSSQNVEEESELISDTGDSGYSEDTANDRQEQSSVSVTVSSSRNLPDKTKQPVKRSERLKTAKRMKEEKEAATQNAVAKEGKKEKLTSRRKGPGGKRRSAVSKNRKVENKNAKDSTGSVDSMSFHDNMDMLVKLEPLDDENLLINQVISDIVSPENHSNISSGSVLTNLTCTTDRRRRLFGATKQRGYRARVQKAYRARQKARLGEVYMEKERVRQRKRYVPASQLDYDSLLKRRKMNREHGLKHRLKRKLQTILNGSMDDAT